MKLCSHVIFKSEPRHILPFENVKPKDREELYDFIVNELNAVSEHQPRIRKFITSLVFQKKMLMSALWLLDEKLQLIAERYGINIDMAWNIAYVARYGINSPSYHTRSSALEEKLGDIYDAIEDDILKVIEKSDRSSSMVENFNSRLKPYLDERKGFSDERLILIQFILNHKPFHRSAHPTNRGKTPAQLMTGNDHPHWLELLGFEKFKRAA